jgi:hypothetical protein
VTITVPEAPALATKRDVELVQAGQWDLSTGRVTFTPGDLASAVAALDCPAIRRPILKLGHVDPRFDGEPAVGWVDNVALADSGNTIVGDYVGMPGWLGDILASAYPDRSIEGCFDFRCQLGHTHPFVLTAVALLGVSAPGIGTLGSLQDVAALYGVAATADQTGEHVAVTIHATREDPMPNSRPAEVAAGVSSEDVRRAYYENAPYSVWICEMQLEPLQLITVDDDSGQYARVPIVLDGDTVTFGESVPVVIEYVDKPQGQQTAASALVFASRAESRPEQAPAPSVAVGQYATGVNHLHASETAQEAIQRVAKASGLAPANQVDPTDPPAEPVEPNTPTEGAPMALDEGLRTRLGLAEDADEATILAALDDKLTAPTAPADGDKPAEPTEPEAPALPEGVRMIDEAQLQELQEQAREGVAARAQQRTEARDRALDDAVKAGKFAPARRDHWARLYDADPEGTKTTLASLEAGLVPLADKGAPGGEETKDAFDAEFDAMFPPHTIAKG